MRDWLVTEYVVFGVPTQHWMWLVAAAFLLYGVFAALTRNGRPAA